MTLSNDYAPEHLILQVDNAESLVKDVQNAGSVFIGAWTPESVGDYSAGVNHSLRKSLSATAFPPISLISLANIFCSSYLRLRQAVLRCQPWLLLEAHHQL